MPSRPLTVLSIQSHVAYGHVGNSAAVFPLQRLGCEVWPIHTVQFSNHPAYGKLGGEVLSADHVEAVATGIADLGQFARCDAVLSGYMGSFETGAAIVRAAARAKRDNPAALYCCDPVIGDVDAGIYVRPGLPEFIRDVALPAADILTPNQFELEYLAGAPVRGIADVAHALRRLHQKGPSQILATSLALEDTPADAIDMAASDGTEFWRVRTPRLEAAFSGSGDVTTALFLAHRLQGRSVANALALAASSIFGLLRRSAEAGEREIALVAAQEEIVAPSHSFRAEPIALA